MAASNASVMTNKSCLSFSFSFLLLLVVTNSGCVGVTASAGGLSVGASNLNFGDVGVGTSRVLAVTFTNSGRANITISGTSISGPGFDATGVSAGTVLSPGQIVTLNVTFAPAGAGGVSGRVTITSDHKSPTTVGLSGVGVQFVGTNPVGNNAASDNALSSITVTPSDPIIPPGSQLQFKALDDLGNDITPSVVWASSDTSIATITQWGLATAIADGNVTITATK
jgi:hypothetical protein